LLVDVPVSLLLFEAVDVDEGGWFKELGFIPERGKRIMLW